MVGIDVDPMIREAVRISYDLGEGRSVRSDVRGLGYGRYINMGFGMFPAVKGDDDVYNTQGYRLEAARANPPSGEGEENEISLESCAKACDAVPTCFAFVIFGTDLRGRLHTEPWKPSSEMSPRRLQPKNVRGQCHLYGNVERIARPRSMRGGASGGALTNDFAKDARAILGSGKVIDADGLAPADIIPDDPRDLNSIVD